MPISRSPSLPVFWSFNFSLSPPLETVPEGRKDEKQINHLLIVSSSGKYLEEIEAIPKFFWILFCFIHLHHLRDVSNSYQFRG